MSDVDEIKPQLKIFGKKDDVPLGETALLLAAYDQSGIHLDRYENHLKKLIAALEERIKHREGLTDAGEEVVARIELINDVIRAEFGYKGDEIGYDNLDNISLIRVIERRKGLPVALGILYIHIARAVGWRMDGLNFPGHFLIRLDYRGQRQIFDPFYEGQIMDAARLRDLVKTMLGQGAELNYDYYNPMDNRSIILRLRNNIKTRMIAGEDFKGALDIVKTMLWIAPKDVRLHFDAGVLNARLDYRHEAIENLEYYIAHVGNPMAASEASALLLSLRNSLN